MFDPVSNLAGCCKCIYSTTYIYISIYLWVYGVYCLDQTSAIDLAGEEEGRVVTKNKMGAKNSFKEFVNKKVFLMKSSKAQNVTEFSTLQNCHRKRKK